MSRDPRPPMSLEVGVVALVVCAIVAVRGHLQRNVAVGDLLVAAALLLLGQGFVRDVLRRAGTSAQPSGRSVQCVCVESVVGLSTIVAGLALGLGWGRLRVEVAPLMWATSAVVVGGFGIAVREVVFDWRDWRFRREVDHGASVAWNEVGR